MNTYTKPNPIKNKVMRKQNRAQGEGVMELNKLNKILDDHRLWLKTNRTEGKEADLRSANLNSADLRFADLRYANLNSADLRFADLRYANLRSANLNSADLSSANLSSADLRSANLRSANLRSADLSSANLNSADLNSADLNSANLSSANLNSADLNSADLSSANLNSADLSSADLRSANLRSADLDFSAFPLWCGGLSIHVDDKQAKQLLYHLIQNVQFSSNTSKSLKKLLLTKTIIKKANEFHRVNECGKIVLELDKEL